MKIIKVTTIVVSAIYVHLVLHNCCTMLKIFDQCFFQRKEEKARNKFILKKKKNNTSYRAFGRWPDIGGAIHWSYTATEPRPSTTISLSWVSVRLPFSVEILFVSGKEFPFSTTGSTFELCYEPSKKLRKKTKKKWKTQ